jgi:hypothetical protein
MDTNGDGIGAGSGEDSSGQRHQLRSIYDKPSYRFAGKKYPVNTVAPQ